MTRAFTTVPGGGERPLPAGRAFVVQLQADADVPRGHWVGRIVHVVSGQSAHFETQAELVGFIERVLAGSAAEQPPEALKEP